MKAKALHIHTHETQPIYSVHFEGHGTGRLATAGGDNNVRLWTVQGQLDGIPKLKYLCTLARHTQAVNVVRFSPAGGTLASAGDDGNILIWIQTDKRDSALTGANIDWSQELEFWRVRLMCRSYGSEIYDLAWSPDSNFLVCGSMDNIVRIYDANDGQCIKQFAEHHHYVQGVAWDPLNEYIASQSSDRTLHVYSLRSRDGILNLSHHGKNSKLELPSTWRPVARKSFSQTSDMSSMSDNTTKLSKGTNANTRTSMTESQCGAELSPVTSMPGTPVSTEVSMLPPPTVSYAHRRASSVSSASSIRRSVSPSPGLGQPLPAVMPIESPKLISHNITTPVLKSFSLYYNEQLLSFFRRLTFTPDGCLLLTPAGMFKSSLFTSATEASLGDLPEQKKENDYTNAVYIYTRAGLNRPPVAQLVGFRKPAIAISCSPIYYTLREKLSNTDPTEINIDLSDYSKERPEKSEGSTEKARIKDETLSSTKYSEFSLPYRMVFAVATQDAVYIYDTQQCTPIFILTNLHCATFTDLSW